MMEMIPFYSIFPNVVGFWVGGGGDLRPPEPLFHIYIFCNQKLYIIFCANTIVSSATRHHSNIFLASTNNILGILKADI